MGGYGKGSESKRYEFVINFDNLKKRFFCFLFN